ncbi:hypothetical protein [Amaricoccus tamworthensis]|uniref:hypothetical protein n=1 Tax=Amaricoccus tamworthensis TaxID=57002 RepID=UPI003C7EBABE
MSEVGHSAPAEAAIREELQRILASKTFTASTRNRNFLSYVVDETLAGRGNRIKAYSVATQVFGRGDDFDPLLDSIVRIEAGRLRRELERFYLKESHPGGVTINIPKGGYVPSFEIRKVDTEKTSGSERASSGPAILHNLGPSVIVHRFEEAGDCSVFPGIGRKLSWQVISALTRYTEIFVFGYETTDYLADAVGHSDKPQEFQSDYELFGTVTVSKEALNVDLLFRRTPDRRFVWAHDFKCEIDEGCTPSEMVEVCNDIAGQIVRKIADRDGILDCQARESAGQAPNTFAAYQKLLEFHDYWRSLDPKLYESLRRDLEKTVSEDPNFANGLSCLSMVYSSAVRYVYDISHACTDPLERAFELANRAILLAPNSSRAYHARAIAEWFSGLTQESLKTLQHARSLNPNDSEILAELGFRYAMRAKWGLAVPLIEESYIRNPMQATTYRMGLFLYHYAEGRYDTALRECVLINAPSVGNVRVCAAAAHCKLGQFAEAHQELREAKKIDPDLPSRLEADLMMRNVHPDLIHNLVSTVAAIDPRWAIGNEPGRLKA